MKQKLEHKAFGLGTVLYKIPDDAPKLLVKFADKKRLMLLDAPGWTDPEAVRAAFEIAKDAPAPKAPVRKAKRVRGVNDVEPEPIAVTADPEEESA